MQSKVVKILATLGVAAAVFIGSVSNAEAAFKLRLTSGASTATVTDEGAGDVAPGAGVIAFVGSMGSFNLNIETGISSSPSGDPLLQLISANEGTGSLRIELTDTNFNFGSALTFDLNGTALFGDLVASAFFGTSEFEQGTQIGSSISAGPGSGSMVFGTSTGMAIPGGTGSLTIVVDITNATDPNGGLPSFTSFDATIAPEPATMGLFGLALFGLAGVVRRRFTN